MNKILLWWCALFALCLAQYEIPDVLIEPLSPKGFKVSIPDEGDIKLFAFHGKLNEELVGVEAGTFSMDINKPKDGRWTFVDRYTRLKNGDVLYYWTYVILKDGGGYQKLDQNYTFTGLPGGPGTTSTTTTTTTTKRPTKEPSTEPPSCELGLTIVRGNQACRNQLIFEENFDSIDEQKWIKEIKFAGEPDYEFVVYKSDEPTIVYTSNGLLHIKPTFTESKYGEGIINGQLDLGLNCTGDKGTDQCSKQAFSFYILPPVISGKIATKFRFGFTYGVVEIRAKLPAGDWVYPQIYLEPLRYYYGKNYDSGQMRVAFCPGNENLNRQLGGGVILGTSQAARAFGLRHSQSLYPWNDGYHVYKLKWTPNEITVSVDGQVYGQIVPPDGGFAKEGRKMDISAAERWAESSHLAPFDQEMHLSLGVGIGGHCFPDISGKPWRNNDPKNILRFWMAKNEWFPSWNENSELIVDYVKVWSL